MPLFFSSNFPYYPTQQSMFPFSKLCPTRHIMLLNNSFYAYLYTICFPFLLYLHSPIPPNFPLFFPILFPFLWHPELLPTTSKTRNYIIWFFLRLVTWLAERLHNRCPNPSISHLQKCKKQMGKYFWLWKFGDFHVIVDTFM